MKRILSLLLVVPALLAGCGHAAAGLPGTISQATLAARSVRTDTPADVTTIRSLAAQGLQAAAADQDWDSRYTASNHALLAITDVPLQDHSQTDLAAKMGVLAANGYGYFGFRPPSEDRYNVQVVVLQYLSANQSEATLSRGTPIFTMAASMVSATSGYDQGCKVGISVLTCLRDYYKDPNISRAAGDTLKTALQAADKPACQQVMLDGLKKLGQSAAR